jgi:hydroxymethylbilane synthase
VPAPIGDLAPLRIGTRGSPLALAQANTVAALLAAAQPLRPAPTITIIRTTGDAIQDRALREAGGKGLFTKELDAALIDGTIDLAVHSAKDLPTELPQDLEIAGYLPREDVRDVWICPNAAHPRALRPGAVVGTASLRRAAMVKRLRPDVEITLLRGNVQTRLAKLAAGDVDATLLALAGLKRLGLTAAATTILDTDDFLPAAGQGAIAIVTRADDANGDVIAICDAATGFALAAERAFLHVLDGSCRTPIGAYAQIENDTIDFRGLVLRPDGSDAQAIRMTGATKEATALGTRAGAEVRRRLPPDFFTP